MAARVTATDVRAILETETLLTDAQIEAIIVSANVTVNSVLGTETTDLLKEIERWLTGHMIAISKERQATKEEAGGAKIEYTGKYGLGLQSTSYGQMVLSLDTTGAFAATMLKPIKVYAVPENYDS